MIMPFPRTKQPDRFPAGAPLALLAFVLSLQAFAPSTSAQKLSADEGYEPAIETSFWESPAKVS